jgi:uncharacterized Fe-S cluster-containing radical SAM superfamily protein
LLSKVESKYLDLVAAGWIKPQIMVIVLKTEWNQSIENIGCVPALITKHSHVRHVAEENKKLLQTVTTFFGTNTKIVSHRTHFLPSPVRASIFGIRCIEFESVSPS